MFGKQNVSSSTSKYTLVLIRGDPCLCFACTTMGRKDVNLLIALQPLVSALSTLRWTRTHWGSVPCGPLNDDHPQLLWFALSVVRLTRELWWSDKPCVSGWGLYPNRAPQARAQEDRPESTRPRGDAGMRASRSRFRCHYLTAQLEGKAQPARTRASTMTAQARAKTSKGPGEHGT